MTHKYACKKDEQMAFAVGRNLSISTKHAVCICTYLRGKKLDLAKRLLEATIEKKHAIPMTRFNDDTAHKPGIGPGKYPEKAASKILIVINSAESNAQNKGLNTTHLIIKHICAHKASAPSHYGRRRTKGKRTHVEVGLLEEKPADSKKKSKTETKKEVKK